LDRFSAPQQTKKLSLTCQYRETAMAEDKRRLESLTGIENDVQIEERAKHAMEAYFSWLQNAMSAIPLSNTNLNRILLSNATQNITATLAFVQKLSQAKNFEEVVKLQTEFMGTQMNSFNEQAKVLSETYTKAAEDAMKSPFGVRK
jgi:hypothetical protein